MPGEKWKKERLPALVRKLLRGYEDAWSRRDAEALAELFTEDGFVLRPGSPPVQGQAAILEAYRGSGGPLALWAYGYAVDGSVGYIVGGFAERPGQPPGGKFVLALRRSDSGAWLIAADMDNGDSR